MLKGSAAHNDALHEAVKASRTGEALFFDLAVDDLTRAGPPADQQHRRLGIRRGLPLVAHDTASTLKAAKDLFARAGRTCTVSRDEGRAPGHPGGHLRSFAGIPVNVTLLFSREQYLAAEDAPPRGVGGRIAAGLDPDVRSVASVSAWPRQATAPDAEIIRA